MRRLNAWLAGLAGGLAAYRVFKRRPVAPPQPAAPDPAAELKAKLAAARAAADDRDAFEAGETPVDQAADPETRRRSVHEQARAAIDEMRDE
jgi:hypothetical protein